MLTIIMIESSVAPATPPTLIKVLYIWYTVGIQRVEDAYFGPGSNYLWGWMYPTTKVISVLKVVLLHFGQKSSQKILDPNFFEVR